MGKMTN
jgi:hypothetical protein